MLNSLIIKTLPLMPKPLVASVAKKYIAGSTLSQAVNVTKELALKGAFATIDVLGEFVDSKQQAEHEFRSSMEVLDAIKEHKLQAYLSIKPTSLGLGIDVNYGYNHIAQIVKKADSFGIFVRMDMENTPYTTDTLNAYKKLRAEGLSNCGVVLQAYLKRTQQDIRELADYKPNIRLCKGIYVESDSVAFKHPEEIRKNYKECFHLLMESATKVGIATHDDVLIDSAVEYVKKHNIAREQYEFQMLLGVRENKRDSIIAAGHSMRIYVPFGEDWYGYSIRRLKENPAVARNVIKAFFSPNS
jgi:proline dehydrogenase